MQIATIRASKRAKGLSDAGRIRFGSQQGTLKERTAPLWLPQRRTDINARIRNIKRRLPDLFGAILFELLLTQLHAQTGSVRHSQAATFNPMRFVNDVAGQVQLLIVYGKHQVGKSSGEMQVNRRWGGSLQFTSTLHCACKRRGS